MTIGRTGFAPVVSTAAVAPHVKARAIWGKVITRPVAALRIKNGSIYPMATGTVLGRPTVYRMTCSHPLRMNVKRSYTREQNALLLVLTRF